MTFWKTASGKKDSANQLISRSQDDQYNFLKILQVLIFFLEIIWNPFKTDIKILLYYRVEFFSGLSRETNPLNSKHDQYIF